MNISFYTNLNTSSKYNFSINYKFNRDYCTSCFIICFYKKFMCIDGYCNQFFVPRRSTIFIFSQSYLTVLNLCTVIFLLLNIIRFFIQRCCHYCLCVWDKHGKFSTCLTAVVIFCRIFFVFYRNMECISCVSCFSICFIFAVTCVII